MKKNLIATAALLTAALAVSGAGTAAAAPADTKVKPVHYQISQTPQGAKITIKDGTLTVDGNDLNIRAQNGQSVAQLPLTWHLNDRARPIKAEVQGTTATLIPVRTGPGRPVTPVTRKVSLEQAKHSASESFTPRDQQELAAFSNRSTIGSFTSAAVGAAVGAGVGCIIGAVSAAALTLPIAMLLGAGPLGGCVAGAVLLAPAGAAAGLVFVGLPIILFSAFQYFSTIGEPCDPKAPYCNDPRKPKDDKKKSAKPVQVAAA
ncbi:hypothetical protein GCM10010528_03150 [Gordonia defluvii]|jgi:hypothetical protein|uniref:DUF8020 domain-containing protein n=1 Tax=Gordonia defluvii TaxID=283718 RepID=A0ABN3YE23_9ACTN|nr:hypothetical protein [Gordonia sp. UBA5067]